ncbi:MAG TPA: protein phosphatase 2C domain-containing protein [Blastocatellia bacterium]|nr:protein phosphatase 2C domain-containing protein [Blastocatellia bacterium]
MQLDVGWVCDRGLSHKRPVNEDRALVRPDAGLFVVCDGVGGHSSGEVASQLAVDTIEEALAHHDGDDVEELLENAVRYANRDIFEMAASDPRYFGMGTTIALLFIDRNNGRAIIGHAGDSRVYRFDSTLHRETYDHTDLDDALRAGRLSPQQAMRLGKQNTINRALGIESDVVAEFKTIPYAESDSFLLCSDGVTRHIDDAELEELFESTVSADDMCEEIRTRCYARGAEDNLTAVVVSPLRPGATARPALEIPVAGSTPSRGFEPIHQSRNSGEMSAMARGILVLCAIALASIAFWVGRASVTWVASTRQAPVPAAAAREAFERGDYAAARSSFERLAHDEPLRADYHFWLGRTALEQGNAAEAVEHLQTCASLGATAPETFLYLAAALQLDHRDKDAAEALRKFAELESAATTANAPPSSTPRTVP